MYDKVSCLQYLRVFRMNFQLPMLPPEDYERLKDLITSEKQHFLAHRESPLTDEVRTCRDTLSIQVRVPTSEHVAEIVGKQGKYFILLHHYIIVQDNYWILI